MATFDRELATGLDDEADPMSDHPFGAFYHWCALLCGLGEAALEHRLLSPSPLEPIRQDLEAGVPVLKACRQLLIVVPASLEEHPLIVTLVRDGDTFLKHRMSGASTFSIELSERKAYTSALVGMRTGDLLPLVQPGRDLFPLMTVAGGRYCAMGGGTPLCRDGARVAGVGVSGGTVEQDVAILEAALQDA